MQDLCVTATRDHNMYASFRPSIATKDAETRSKMNSAFLRYPVGRKFRRNSSISHSLGDMSTFAFFRIQNSQLLIYLINYSLIYEATPPPPPPPPPPPKAIQYNPLTQ